MIKVRVCPGIDYGEGRCAGCTLPMDRHPIMFVLPKRIQTAERPDTVQSDATHATTTA